MNSPRVRKPLTIRNTLLAASIGIALLAALIAIIWYFAAASIPDRSLKHVSTLAGVNGEFGEPFGVAISGDTTYVSDGQSGRVVGISKTGKIVSTENFDTPSGIAFGKGEYANLLVVDSGRNTIYKLDPSPTAIAGAAERGFADGDAANARFNGPIGIAVGNDGKVFIADTYNDRIRVIEKGQVTTLAGSSRGFSDGLGGSAKFDTPTGLAVWGDKLLVADTGNRRIRVVEKDGTVWTLAGNGGGDLVNGSLLSASFVQPVGIAVDDLGSIFVADGNAIRVISGAVPIVSTISDENRGLAGGVRSKARFNRPSGLAINASGELIFADSENRLVRRLSSQNDGHSITAAEIDALRDKPADFRAAAPARWPYDPPTATRDIAGTLGEIRGEMTPEAEQVWFHNGLDIAGGYGETARFMRDEKVLRPIAAENFGTLRELIRMPTLGYIHIRLGRNADGKTFGDERFQFQTDATGKPIDVRVPRGAKFKAGEAIGTLNPMNHVHLVAGRSGSEMNALDALSLPGASDSRPPVIEKVSIYDQNWNPVETSPGNPRIKLSEKTRVVVRAYDQMDGNSERRRLGVYQLGYQLLKADKTPLADPKWTITFDRMPSNAAVKFAYSVGSHSGATGETIFNYIVTNQVSGDEYREDFLDPVSMAPGQYVLRVFAKDYFGNESVKDIEIALQQ